MERLTALLIELYAGSFPVWLAPVQVQVLPVGPDQQPAAERLLEELRSAELRAEIVGADSSLGRRIRQGRDRQIPYAAVIGAREAADAAVALRRRDGVQVPPVAASVAVAAIKALAGSRSLSLELDLPATDNR
jgi:threonyl-tRNA synthetase